jgi:DNA polymerase I-like protein with 3'-5' exonuclease and polymerase domains
MLKIARNYKVALTVHDSVVCIAPKDEAEKAAEFVTNCMKWRPKWAETLPLNCEVGYGENYAAA